MEDSDSFPSSSSDIQATPKRPAKQNLPSHTPVGAIKTPATKRNRLDYIIYRINNDDNEVIALIVETTMSKVSQHVHAQVSID